MVELLELAQASLMITAVTVAAMTVPVAVVTDAEMPDLKPLIEMMEDK